MIRQPLFGRVLRRYDDKAYLVHDRKTDEEIGAVIAWHAGSGAYEVSWSFIGRELAQARTRAEALRGTPGRLARPDTTRTDGGGTMTNPDTADRLATLEALVDAQTKLLAHYRTGSRPPGRLLDRLRELMDTRAKWTGRVS